MSCTSGLGRTWNGFEMSTPSLPRSEKSNTGTQPFRTPTLTPIEKKPTMSGRQEELRVRFGYDVWACVEVQENSEKTEVEACRKTLHLGRYTRGNAVQSGDRRKVAARHTKEERQNWFNGLAKDASEYEDRRTVLTRWVVLSGGGVRLEWKKTSNIQERRRYKRVRQLVDGPTKTLLGAWLVKCSGVWNQSAPRWGYESFEAKQLPRRLPGANGWILGRKIWWQWKS